MKFITDNFAEAGFSSEEAYRSHLEWIFNRTSSIFSEDSLCGSGVPIITLDGRKAVLTAKHVVVRAIWSGEVTIQPFPTIGIRTTIAYNVWIDRVHDLAVVFLRDDQAPVENFIPVGTQPNFANDGDLISCNGSPFEKNQDAIKKNKKSGIPVFTYFSYITKKLKSGDPIYHRADVLEGQHEIPKSFEAMSGGPVFSATHKLLGINIHEKRGSKKAHIAYLPMDKVCSFLADIAAPINQNMPVSGPVFFSWKDREISVRVHGRKIALVGRHWIEAATKKEFFSLYGFRVVPTQSDALEAYALNVPWTHISLSKKKPQKSLENAIKEILKEAALFGHT